MIDLKFKANGIVPLLMHCNQTANPLNRYSQFMKPLTAKRNKTDQDHMELARIEWEAGLYLRDGIIVLPAENLDRCLWDAAKKTKNGKKYKEGAMISEDYMPLSYRGPKIKVKENGSIPNQELNKFYETMRHQGLVKVNGATMLRTRPIFHDWSFDFSVMIDDTVIDDRTMFNIIETAGKYVGLCEKRPRLGRFEIARG